MNPARRLAALILTGATLAGGGCAASPAVEPRPAGPDRHAATPPASESPAADEARTPEALAAQAQRDVDAILRQSESPAEKPPVIRWSREHETTVAAADPVTAAPGQPAFEPGPLFRVADRPPLVPPTPPDDVPEPKAAPAMTNASPIVEALTAERADELTVELARELYHRSSYDDVPLRQLLVVAALAITDPERDLSPEAIPGLTSRERETLEHFQAFCRRLGRELQGQSEADAVLVDALTALRDDLVEAPRLGLPTATLCYHVEGFGRFRAFDRNAFLAHNGQQVILYLEIADFASEINEQGEWVTQLAQQLMIYSDRDGIPVWKADWQTAVDASRNQRQDFFTVQVITIPDALGVGRYHLKVRVRDEKSGAEAETAIEFEMVADRGLAASVRP